jgi:hypothetical protein
MAADVVSKIGTLWYTNAGAMDRIDNFFYWSKLRWKFDKVELLQRTKEWNDMGFLTESTVRLSFRNIRPTHVHRVLIRPARIGRQSHRSSKHAPNANNSLLIVLAIVERKIGRRSTSVLQPM